MFQFPGFPPVSLWIRKTVAELFSAGFPHSDICGSMSACDSPQLFAAGRVLLRRLVPWHPPCALLRLITLLRPTFRCFFRLPTLTGLSTLFSSLCSCQDAPALSRPLRSSLRNPENDTGSVLRLVSSEGVLPLFGRLSGLSCRPSRAVRPRLKSSPFDSDLLPRKEVIQPHLPIRLPCYDFTPVIDLTLGCWLLAVTSHILGAINSHGVTGGVYKARERIHRGMLIRDY